MTRRRWIADQVEGDRAALTGDNAAHVARVLRARPGQEFEIAAGDRVRLGRVTSVREHRVEFELGQEIAEAAEAGTAVTLYLAVFKFDRMEWAIEKATELGVNAIVPLLARRTDSHLAQAAAKRAERWRRIAHEAAQQSRRASAPEIASPISLQQLLQSDVAPTSRRRESSPKQEDVVQPPSAGLRIVLAETERERTLATLLNHPERSEGPQISLAVGPEGGWTADELDSFDRAGWQRASLGPRILRAETAAVAALAIVTAARDGAVPPAL